MDYTLELVVVPVSDVDRAKSFYVEQASAPLSRRFAEDYLRGIGAEVVVAEAVLRGPGGREGGTPRLLQERCRSRLLPGLAPLERGSTQLLEHE